MIEQGKTYTILNANYSGQFVVEGKATALHPINENDKNGMWRVQMEGSGEIVTRFIDPAAQDNPQQMIDRLNG